MQSSHSSLPFALPPPPSQNVAENAIESVLSNATNDIPPPLDARFASVVQRGRSPWRPGLDACAIAAEHIIDHEDVPICSALIACAAQRLAVNTPVDIIEAQSFPPKYKRKVCKYPVLMSQVPYSARDTTFGKPIPKPSSKRLVSRLSGPSQPVRRSRRLLEKDSK